MATTFLIWQVIQLFETLLVRHGVMVVGLTLTGKSTCHAALAGALTQLKRDGEEAAHYEATKRHMLNPKAVKMGELYGEVNPITQVLHTCHCMMLGGYRSCLEGQAGAGRVWRDMW